MDDITHMHGLEGLSSLANSWCITLPFDRSTISALRATLSVARHDHINEDLDPFLVCIDNYIMVRPGLLFPLSAA